MRERGRKKGGERDQRSREHTQRSGGQGQGRTDLWQECAQAEVADAELHAAVAHVHQDVLGLEVPVRDLGWGGGQGVKGLGVKGLWGRGLMKGQREGSGKGRENEREGERERERRNTLCAWMCASP